MTDEPQITAYRPTCPQCGAPVALPGYADTTVCSYCGTTLRRGRLGVREDEDPQADQQRLRSVRCSQCAGPLSVREGKRVLVCDHCGVRVVLLEHGGLTRWYFPARVDRRRALAAAADWLKGYPGIAEPVRGARPVEAKLAYAPIWEHRVYTAGWEFGSKHRTRVTMRPYPMTTETEQSMEVELVREGVHEPRLQERRFYLAAADFDALGACRPRITGRELLAPLLAGELEAEALVLEAKGEVAEVVEKGRSAALLPLTGALNPQLHLFLFRENKALLYYPLWLLRFRDGESYCRVVVDGRDGTVNSGRAPADQTKRVVALTAKIFALAVGVVLLAYFGATFRAGRAPLLAAAVVFAAAAVVLGMRYRPQKEVEYHDSFSG